MSATPFAARGVRFEDISIASFGSPLSVAAPTSIDYLNSQLVAHGFTHGSGLNLADLRGRDQQDVLKCLANMLGQRLDDMSRTEQLSTKYKTLSYDHERLVEQHRLTKEATAQAQREMETGKAKADAAQKKLTVEEDSHRQSRDSYQRLKTAMAYLRTTTSNDIKRKEKEVEKMTDKWSKIANDQAKLGAIGAGLACANLLPEQQSMEESNGIWEAALADSEAARLRLLKENDSLRDVVTACANALQTLHHDTISSLTKTELEEPELILSDVLFVADATNSKAETAQEKLRELFASLREAISKASSKGNSRRQSMLQRQEDASQIKALQEANEELQAQLNEVQEAARTQGQQLLEQFVADARFTAGQRHLADMSMDLMGTPNKDVMAEQIEEQRQHLESERDKFTEAAVKLGREKAALEAERLQFLEEKRAFMVQSILDDLPPTPEAAERTQPAQPLTRLKPLADLANIANPPPAITASTRPAASEVAPAAQIPTYAVPSRAPLVLEQAALGASTTPPFTDDELSPTSPTEQLSRPLPTASSSRSKSQATPSLPPSFRTQTTPVRPVFSQARIQHKYSPAVPSPLSRVVRVVESPPSSPEGMAQREAQRPPVIAEEDEEEEEVGVSVNFNVHIETAVVEDVSDDDEHVDELPVNMGGRPGSLSPLSRIMNMGLSPAIAPTLAIPSFPGLLGTGSLTQDLLTKPKQTSIGFGKMPGGFQLGTAIRAEALLPTATARTGKVAAKTIKTTATTTIVSKQKQPSKVETKPPAKNVVFGENRPRSSKSTSSSGSSSEGRTSRASSKTSSSAGTGSQARSTAAKTVKEKENLVKRKPMVNSRPTLAAVKKPVTAPALKVAKAPTSAAIKKAPVPATRPLASKAPKG